MPSIFAAVMTWAASAVAAPSQVLLSERHRNNGLLRQHHFHFAPS
jgi:hypothetical protein